MKYFIDTEFDGHKGALISMCLFREDGQYRYWVIPEVDIKDPWVIEHVVPFIMKEEPILVEDEVSLSREIARFLKNDETPIICADWLDDIKYFCDVMVFGPGKIRNIRNCQFIFDRELGSYESEVPHNAYYDAKAIWQKFHIDS